MQGFDVTSPEGWKDFRLFVLENGLMSADSMENFEQLEITDRGRQVGAALVAAHLLKTGMDVDRAKAVAFAVMGIVDIPFNIVVRTTPVS